MSLLKEIGAYCRDKDVPVTRFGREAVNDPRFVLDMRNGRTPRENTVVRVRAFMAKEA